MLLSSYYIIAESETQTEGWPVTPCRQPQQFCRTDQIKFAEQCPVGVSKSLLYGIWLSISKTNQNIMKKPMFWQPMSVRPLVLFKRVTFHNILVVYKE